MFLIATFLGCPAEAASPVGSGDGDRVPAGVRYEVLIDSCSAVDGWRVNPGREFPGARGSMKLRPGPDGGVACDVDFSGGGRYCGIERAIFIRNAVEVRFEVWTDTFRNGMVRIRDNTGQEHAAGFRFTPGEWRGVRLRVTPEVFRGHWSGANDGRFHFPLRRLLIAAYPAPGKQTGGFAVRAVRFVTSDPSLRWRLTWVEPRPGNVVYADELPIRFRVNLRNCVAEPVRAHLLIEARDLRGAGLAMCEDDREWKPWELRPYEITIPRRPPGYVVVRAIIAHGPDAAAGGPRWAGETGLVIVRRPQPAPLDAAFFGIHPSAPDAAARIGVQWIRINRAWWWVEGRPGDFYFPDEGLKQALARNMGVMMTLHYQPPGWAVKQAGRKSGWPPDHSLLQGWKRFVAACVRRYRGRVRAWEIQNEPDLTCWRHPGLSFDEGVAAYVRIFDAAYDVLSGLDPGTPVAGVDVSGGDYRNGLRFSKAVLERLGPRLNVYTGHPYASPRYFGEGLRPLFPEQNRLREKLRASQVMLRELGLSAALWIGEKGWGLDVREPIAGEASLAYARCVARALITARSVPGVDRFFWFLQQGCNERGYEYGLWRGSPARPLPAAAAYATAAAFLSTVTPAEQPLRLPDPLRGFLFSSDAGSTAALWAVGDDSWAIEAAWPAGTQAFDMFGAPAPGKVVSISPAPVYITAPVAAARLRDAVERARVIPGEPLAVQRVRFAARDRVAMLLRNRTAGPLDVEVLAGSRRGIVRTKPDSSRTCEFPIPALPAGGAPERLPITVRVANRTFFSTTLVWKPLPCPRISFRCDGDPGEWEAPAFDLRSARWILPADPKVGWKGSGDLSMTLWYGWTPKGFVLAARIRDDVVGTRYTRPTDFWRSDSLQAAFDPLNDGQTGYDPDDREFGVLLDPVHPRVFMTFPRTRVLALPCRVRRRRDITFVELQIPWAVIGMRPRLGRVLGVNVIVNDNDGEGRKFWMGPAPGIGEAKRPGAFPDVVLVGKDRGEPRRSKP